MNNKKVAIILSGCGVFDGSEIYETTLFFLALDRAGIEYQCMVHICWQGESVKQLQVLINLFQPSLSVCNRLSKIEGAKV